MSAEERLARQRAHYVANKSTIRAARGGRRAAKKMECMAQDKVYRRSSKTHKMGCHKPRKNKAEYLSLALAHGMAPELAKKHTRNKLQLYHRLKKRVPA